jgi:hypothetical protein
MSKSTPAKPEQVLRRHWHHDVQESWGRRRLYFALFKFSQLYPQEEVLGDLKQIAADNDVTSYATYEVMGEWDLLGRLYVEPFRQRRLEQDIKERMKQYGLRDQRWLEVHEVVRHWVWTKGRGRQVGSPSAPETSDLQKIWPRFELRKLNDLENVNGKRRPGVANQYVDAHLLTFAKHYGGMKLAIAIQQRGPAPDEFMYEQMKDRLATVLDGAGNWLRERSLYAFGRNNETTFLVMGRLAQDDAYRRVRFDLLQPIGDLVKEMNARVTTYPIVSDELVCFTDRLPPSVVQPASMDIEALLEGPETTEFEIKGSAFTPLDEWLRKGKMTSEADGFCVDTICKEVVAFLNSGGGTLLVGALETKRFGSSEALEDYPRNEHNIICGIMDETYRTRGWDVWERKLRDILRAHIEPTPINAVEIRSVMHGETRLGLLAIDGVEPDYYLCPTKGAKSYWMREGTSARRLEGPELERHRKRMRNEVRRNRRRREEP